MVFSRLSRLDSVSGVLSFLLGAASAMVALSRDLRADPRVGSTLHMCGSPSCRGSPAARSSHSELGCRACVGAGRGPAGDNRRNNDNRSRCSVRCTVRPPGGGTSCRGADIADGSDWRNTDCQNGDGSTTFGTANTTIYRAPHHRPPRKRRDLGKRTVGSGCRRDIGPLHPSASIRPRAGDVAVYRPRHSFAHPAQRPVITSNGKEDSSSHRSKKAVRAANRSFGKVSLRVGKQHRVTDRTTSAKPPSPTIKRKNDIMRKKRNRHRLGEGARRCRKKR